MLRMKWEPDWYADIDENEEDSDYLSRQGCCSVCGAYIGNLPGYYWIESDYCPNCINDRDESWSDELKRLTEEYNLGDETAEDISMCEEMGI